jgi:hypothetical protein
LRANRNTNRNLGRRFPCKYYRCLAAAPRRTCWHHSSEMWARQPRLAAACSLSPACLQSPPRSSCAKSRQSHFGLKRLWTRPAYTDRMSCTKTKRYYPSLSRCRPTGGRGSRIAQRFTHVPETGIEPIDELLLEPSRHMLRRPARRREPRLSSATEIVPPC